MTHKLPHILAFAFLLSPLSGHANECWSISNIKGHSAYADQGYKFSTDGLRDTLVCFGTDSGVVTGTDTKFVKFDESTLIGLGGSNQGNAIVEVYQLGRKKMKLLYVRSRIGTKTVAPLFSDVVSAFVGDAVLVRQ